MNLAAIDLGSNSTRLYICSANGNQIKPLLRETVITRLGEQVAKTKKLNNEAMNRALRVLQTYKKKLIKLNVEKCVAVGTSALRQAENSREFLTKAEKILGFKPNIISGRKEAELTYWGATAAQKNGFFLVIDIGGGSTELIYGRKEEIIFSTSLLLGCVSLAEMFLTSDPPVKAQLQEAKAYVQKILAHAQLPALNPATKAIAVAGTPTSLVAIKNKVWPYDPKKVHGQTLLKEEINTLSQQLSSLPLAERKKIIGLQPQRAEVIVSGTIILLAVLESFNIGSVIVSERDILDGLIFALNLDKPL